MPFKIVQTFERGKKFLSCVPSSWENNNVLLWPRKGSKKLQKNESSLPGDDWISTPCQLKRFGLTYEEAQQEIAQMQRESDTEEDRSLQKRHQINTNDMDMNALAVQCILNKENISPVEVLPAEVAEEPKIYMESEQETTTTSTATPFIENQETEPSTYILINSNSEKSNFEGNVMKRLDQIDKTHETIMLKLFQLSAQIDEFLRQAQKQKIVNDLGFTPIDDIEGLENFDDSLKNVNTAQMIKDKLSVICGSGNGKGLNNCFALIDVMFTHRFLTQCSWSGGTKKADSKKHCFKAYRRVTTLFFEIIHYSDQTFTLLQSESFLKSVLKNSERRNAAKMLRASATKTRVKKSKKLTQVTNTVLPGPSISLTYPPQGVVALQTQALHAASLQGSPAMGTVLFDPQTIYTASHGNQDMSAQGSLAMGTVSFVPQTSHTASHGNQVTSAQGSPAISAVSFVPQTSHTASHGHQITSAQGSPAISAVSFVSQTSHTASHGHQGTSPQGSLAIGSVSFVPQTSHTASHGYQGTSAQGSPAISSVSFVPQTSHTASHGHQGMSAQGSPVISSVSFAPQTSHTASHGHQVTSAQGSPAISSVSFVPQTNHTASHGEQGSSAMSSVLFDPQTSHTASHGEQGLSAMSSVLFDPQTSHTVSHGEQGSSAMSSVLFDPQTSHTASHGEQGSSTMSSVLFDPQTSHTASHEEQGLPAMSTVPFDSQTSHSASHGH